MEQTAVDLLIEDLQRIMMPEQMADIEWWLFVAKRREKQQMDKVAGDWWNEGASYMRDGGRKYESFEKYYNETFKPKEI